MKNDKTLAESLAESLLEHELKGPDFLTYLARPMNAGQVNTWSDLSPDGGKGTAIVIHGAMVYDHHFTRETIRIYQRHYPEAIVILSTWDDENREYLDDFQEPNLIVVTRAKPGKPGIKNSELIRIPAHAGVAEAAKHSVTHVLLTRTDQRMYAPNLIDYFLTLMKCFPLGKGVNQKGRIIAPAYGTRKYWPYCVSTAFMFGHLEDLASYWDAPPDRRDPQPTDDNAEPNVLEHVVSVSSHYFLTHYLKKIGMDHTNTVADSWRIMAELFCLVDKEMVDLYWYKAPPDRYHAMERRGNWYEMKIYQYMTFRDWLTLCRHTDLMQSANGINLSSGIWSTTITKTMIES